MKKTAVTAVKKHISAIAAVLSFTKHRSVPMHQSALLVFFRTTSCAPPSTMLTDDTSVSLAFS